MPPKTTVSSACLSRNHRRGCTRPNGLFGAQRVGPQPAPFTQSASRPQPKESNFIQQKLSRIAEGSPRRLHFPNRRGEILRAYGSAQRQMRPKLELFHVTQIASIQHRVQLI